MLCFHATCSNTPFHVCLKAQIGVVRRLTLRQKARSFFFIEQLLAAGQLKLKLSKYFFITGGVYCSQRTKCRLQTLVYLLYREVIFAKLKKGQSSLEVLVIAVVEENGIICRNYAWLFCFGRALNISV